MSARHVKLAWDIKLPVAEKIVLINLAWRANDDDNAFPSWERITAETGLSESTMRRAISALKKKSFIVPRGSTVGGKGHTAVYAVLPGKAPVLDRPVSDAETLKRLRINAEARVGTHVVDGTVRVSTEQQTVSFEVPKGVNSTPERVSNEAGKGVSGAVVNGVGVAVGFEIKTKNNSETIIESAGFAAQWSAVKDYIKSKIPYHSYDTWFAPIKPVGIDGSTVVLLIPTIEFQEVRTKYGALLAEAFQHQNLEVTRVKLITEATA